METYLSVCPNANYVGVPFCRVWGLLQKKFSIALTTAEPNANNLQYTIFVL